MAVVSFITNTLVDECGAAQADDELEDKITGLLLKYVEVIKTVPPTVTIIVMNPFPRVQPTWVFDSLDLIHDKLNTLLEPLGQNIHVFPYLPVTRDDYETDFIHLKPSVCEKQYVNFCNNFTRIFGTRILLQEEVDVVLSSPGDVSATASSSGLQLPPTNVPPPSTNSLATFDQDFNSGDVVVLPRVDHWGNDQSQATPSNLRINPRGQLPGRWASSQKRPAEGTLADRDSNRPRLGNGQFNSGQTNDYRQSSMPRQQQQQQHTNHWGSRGNNNRVWASNPNQSGTSRRQGDLNQGQNNAGRNDSSSGFNGQSRGRGGGGRGRASGATEVWGTIQSSQPNQASNKVLEARVGKLESEMVTNYELTETALNKTNAASVIIDGLPFGTRNSNQPAVTVVRELVETMGGPDSIVGLAFFLSGGPSPAPGTFARIKAVFKSEEFAFEF